MKTVVYGGYEFQVPANWPVYRLDEHPQTCVRYDVHAVYLGKPGPDMRCAAGLVGRTQTVSFIPGPGTAAGAAGGPATRPRRRRPAAPSCSGCRRSTARSRRTPSSTSCRSRSARRPARRSLARTGRTRQSSSRCSTPCAWPRPARRRPRSPRRCRRSQRGPGAGPRCRPSARPRTRSARPPRPRGARRHLRPAAEIVQPSPSPSKPQPKPSAPAEAVPPKPTAPPQPKPPQPKPKPSHPVSGFDTCTAPSLPAMRAWRSDYAAVGVYIGGVNAACAGGNLSASWVRTVAGMGWGTAADLRRAAGAVLGRQRGTDQARQRRRARQGGRRGRGQRRAGLRPCRRLADLLRHGGLQGRHELHGRGPEVPRRLGPPGGGRGYVTGVYSSQDSGIVDMQAAAVSKMPGFTPPDAVWIALWDNVSSLSDGNLTWPLTERNKQYAGNVNADRRRDHAEHRQGPRGRAGGPVYPGGLPRRSARCR